jgi:aldehyde dehydrogenase (NAD+)
MTSVIKSQKWGRWDEPGVWGGPVISQKQLDKVLGYVKSGVDSGATLVTGGKRIDRPGFFIEPSVFINCKDDMKHVKEEIFGPVASILKFSDTEEVIQRANNSQYGLYGAVFSESMKTCNHVSKKLQVGSVSVNNYFLVGADTPFGGYKQSGIGRELGTHAVDAFLENKTIMWDCS